MTNSRHAQRNFHEDLKRRSEVQISSNRGFGLVMAGAGAAIASFGFIAGTTHWSYWLTAAIVFALVAWLRPEVLTPLNRLWFRLGLLMHRVVNPLIMGSLFFVIITPMGLLMRAFGKRPLDLGFKRGVPSYWIARERRESRKMTDQY